MAAPKKVKVKVLQTTPWGRPGDIVEIDTAKHPSVARHIKNGVLEVVKDSKDNDGGDGV